MIDMNNPVAMAAEIVKLRKALTEVLDALGAIDRPWELQGFGIPALRAEEICELVE